MPVGVTVNGSVDADSSGRIDGSINGDITFKGKLIVGPKGVIRGNVETGDLLLYGKIYGHVYCQHKAIIRNKSYVQGNVRSMSIETEEGAVIDGMILKKEDVSVAENETINTILQKEDGNHGLLADEKEKDENPQTWF